MNSVRVYIATTEGPSQVQRIAEEDPEVQCVVCLNGTSQALPISRAYNAFVRKPTGVIERHIGHPVYRMDVSHRIEDGRSWQLGVFVAHALRHAGRLAEGETEPDHVIWVTGEVNNELDAVGVEHVSDKLKNSDALFATWEAAGVRVTVIMPSQNALEPEVAALCKALAHDGVRRFEGVDGVSAVCALVGLDFPGILPVPVKQRRSVISEQTRKPTKKEASVSKLWFAPLIVLMSLGALAGTLWTSGFSEWMSLEKEGRYGDLERVLRAVNKSDCMTCKWSRRLFVAYADRVRPSHDTLQLHAIELRAPAGRTCTSVGFGRIEPERLELSTTTTHEFPSSKGDGLCGMEFRITNTGGDRVHVWLDLVQPGRVSPNARGEEASANAELMPGESASLRVKAPRWVRSNVQTYLYAVAAPRASDDIDTITAPMIAATGEHSRMVRRLARIGLTAMAVSHVVIP